MLVVAIDEAAAALTIGVCVSRSVVSNSLRPSRLSPSRLHSPWNSPGKNTGPGKLFPSSGYLPKPEIKPLSPALQADSFLSKPPGKPGLTIGKDSAKHSNEFSYEY